ncbi:hypothetical protein NC651_018907 [Populus alba x Populus x berolinensis]|nr:hypothetical protein NC651_018907 [Populus alba x Populus x berolinensis]
MRTLCRVLCANCHCAALYISALRTHQSSQQKQYMQ